MPSLTLLNNRVEEKMQSSLKFQDRLNSSVFSKCSWTLIAWFVRKTVEVFCRLTGDRKIKEWLNLASTQIRIQLDLLYKFFSAWWLVNSTLGCVWGSGSLSMQHARWTLTNSDHCRSSLPDWQTDWQTSAATQSHSGKRCGVAHYLIAFVGSTMCDAEKPAQILCCKHWHY